MNLGGLEAIAGAAQLETHAAQFELFMAIPAYDDLAATYSKDYDGVILDRETWEYHEDHADLDDDPDDDDDPAPFFADPRDWSDVARNLQAMKRAVLVEIDSIQDHWADTGASGGTPGWWATLAGGCAQAGPNWLVYETVNTTIYNQLMAISDATLRGTLLFLMDTPSDLGALLGPPLPTGVFTYRTDWVLGLWGFVDVVLETVYATLEAQVPDKAGFFLGQLQAGQPAMTPSDDFMMKVIEEYSFEEDVLYDMYGFEYGQDIDLDGETSAAPLGSVSRFTGLDLGGETIYLEAYMEFEWDGSAVIVEVEWQDDQIDPKDSLLWGGIYAGDGEDELEDFEIEFPYGDTGGQGTVSYMDGDEIFWQLGGVDQIPGFEITILLGASAVAILGLIYVVMKKRKM
jgi:hypothetical protein